MFNDFFTNILIAFDQFNEQMQAAYRDHKFALGMAAIAALALVATLYCDVTWIRIPSLAALLAIVTGFVMIGRAKAELEESKSVQWGPSGISDYMGNIIEDEPVSPPLQDDARSSRDFMLKMMDEFYFADFKSGTTLSTDEK